MRLILALLFGLGGFAVLVALGVWQVQRLAWKENILADIEARIAADPVDLPADPDPVADRYLPVRLEGVMAGDPLFVLASAKGFGPAYRVIAPYQTVAPGNDGRRIMVDLGLISTDDRATPIQGDPAAPQRITGNLHWPDEVDAFTPDPDIAGNTWFARDVPAMASALDTEPLLVVARSVPADIRAQPLPVGIEGIPNNHLGYAIQWFGMAIVWLGMTAYLLWRIRRRSI